MKFRLTATIANQPDLFTTELDYDWMVSVHGNDFLEALEDWVKYNQPIILPFRIGYYVGEGVYDPIFEEYEDYDEREW